jgi:chromosome segregation ATPase
MDYEKELNLLKDNLEKAKSLKYRAEARLEQLKQQETEVIKELEDLGVRPEDLETEIQSLTSAINELFKEANELLPTDLLEKKN